MRIMEAIEALNKRKYAAIEGVGRDELRFVDTEAIRCLTVGLEIDAVEAGRAARFLAHSVLAGLDALLKDGGEIPIGELVESVWMDGFIVGVLFAQLRSERKS